ncbi:hypothetical protein OAE17_04430 [Gammaproteobacteria bacterium]|nr:hypothetical protein [Gammaproteobacteria bacterium]
MKICHLTTCHKFNDHRIFYKHAISQISFGFDVSICAFADAAKPSSFYEEKIYIHILKSPRSLLIFSRFLRALKLCLLSLKSKADVIILHEPELLIFIPFIKIFKKVTVIYDLHEDYPVLIKSRLQKSKIRFLAEKFVLIYMKITLKFVDSRIVVSQTIYDKYCRHGDMIFPNFPNVLIPPDLKKLEHLTPIKIIYAGVIGAKKGADLFHELVDTMNKKSINFELHLCGTEVFSPQFTRPQFKKLVNSNNVYFHGELPLEELQILLSKTHIGLCFLEDNPHHNLSMPSKVFDYISQRNYVLFSNNLQMQELQESHLGEACIYSAESVISKIIEIQRDKLLFLVKCCNERYLLKTILPNYELYLNRMLRG